MVLKHVAAWDVCCPCLNSTRGRQHQTHPPHNPGAGVLPWRRQSTECWRDSKLVIFHSNNSCLDGEWRQGEKVLFFMFQSLTALAERDSHALLTRKAFPLNSEHRSFNRYFWSTSSFYISASKLLLPNSHFTDG